MSILNDLPTLETIREAQSALRADLARLRRRLRLELVFEFVAEAAAVAVALGAVLVALDWLFRPELPARLVLLSLSLAGIVGFLIIRAARRLRTARLDEIGLALTLDRHRPGLGARVVDVLQLPSLLDEERSTASPAMIRLAVLQADEALEQSDWRRLWNRRRTAERAGLLLAALFIPTVFAIAAPDAARLSFARWLRGSTERWPQQTYLTVMGLNGQGRLLAPRDERFVMEVRADLSGTEWWTNRWRRGSNGPAMIWDDDGRGPPPLLPLMERWEDLRLVGEPVWDIGGRGPQPLYLRRKPTSLRAPDEVVVRERLARGARRTGKMTLVGPSRFQYEFPPSPASSSFELTGGDDWLGPIVVERVDRPSLAQVRLRVKESGSADPEFRAVDPAQNPLFLPDSQVELTVVGDQDLAEARLKLNPGEAPPLSRIDERSFSTTWTLREAATVEIALRSAETGLDSRPSFLSIGLLRDREPRVSLRASGVGARVTPVATIPLTLAATDDFGLAALRIQEERTSIIERDEKPEQTTTRSTINLPFESDPSNPTLDRQVRHDASLQADSPEPGTILRFTGEADDHCVQGTQTGRSSALALQVVSPDELFYEILVRQRAERAKFMEILETTENQAQALEGDPQTEALIQAMRAEQSSARRVDQIAGRIADSLQEMKLNQVGSAKSHRLLQEGVVDPLRALASGPMARLRGLLQTLAGAAPGQSASLDEARKLRAEVVAEMRKILDQMSQWESFVDVVNQVADVIKLQQQVLDETEKARETRAEEVFDESR